jgi:hypothetical protein
MDGGICDTSHQMGPFCCRIYKAMNDVMIRLILSSQMCDLPSQMKQLYTCPSSCLGVESFFPGDSSRDFEVRRQLAATTLHSLTPLPTTIPVAIHTDSTIYFTQSHSGFARLITCKRITRSLWRRTPGY